MGRFLLTIILVLLNFSSAYSTESKGGMPQLNPESFSSQLFWLFCFFVLLYTVINFLFIPKIKKIREERDQTIESLISDSKSINESIENIIKKINDDMNKEKEISSIEITKAMNENKKVLEGKVLLLDELLEKKRSTILENLENSKKNIEKKIPEIVISLSDQIFEKILGEKKKSNLSDFKKFLEGTK